MYLDIIQKVSNVCFCETNFMQIREYRPFSGIFWKTNPLYPNILSSSFIEYFCDSLI